MSKSTYTLAAAALITIGSVIPAFGREGKSASLRAAVSGFNEVITAGGAVFSDSSGRFRGRIAANQQSIGYELAYQVVETVAKVGTQYVNQAHLHFGQRHTTGGIKVSSCVYIRIRYRDGSYARTSSIPGRSALRVQLESGRHYRWPGPRNLCKRRAG